MRSTTGRNTPIQYSHENTFDASDESDPIIENLEVLLVKHREEVHMCVENGGSVVGPLLFGDETIAWIAPIWGKGGYSVPSIVEPKYAEIYRCTVDFVRLLEKARSGTASRSVRGLMTSGLRVWLPSMSWTTIPKYYRYSAKRVDPWPPRANAWRFPKPSSSFSPAPILTGTNFHIKPAWQAEIKRMLMSGLTYD